MELVIRKTENGYKWMVEKTPAGLPGETASEFDGGDGKSPLLAQSAREKWGTRVTDSAKSFDCIVPSIFAAVDPQAKWWERLRGNPKRSGEVSQAAFLLKAEMMGFHVALPWGDSERWDFAVWAADGARVVRVQVKGTGRLYRGGYEVQPVHATRNGGKKRYTKKDIDVIAAHVQPANAWYLIPIEKVGRAKSLRLYPDQEKQASRISSLRTARRVGQPKFMRRGPRDWERWREAWEVLGELG